MPPGGCVVPGGDVHAGRTETSILLALDPTWSGSTRWAGTTAPLPELLPLLVRAGVAAASPNGVLGIRGRRRPRRASGCSASWSCGCAGHWLTGAPTTMDGCSRPLDHLERGPPAPPCRNAIRSLWHATGIGYRVNRSARAPWSQASPASAPAPRPVGASARASGVMRHDSGHGLRDRRDASGRVPGAGRRADGGRCGRDPARRECPAASLGLVSRGGRAGRGAGPGPGRARGAGRTGALRPRRPERPRRAARDGDGDGLSIARTAAGSPRPGGTAAVACIRRYRVDRAGGGGRPVAARLSDVDRPGRGGPGRRGGPGGRRGPARRAGAGPAFGRRGRRDGRRLDAEHGRGGHARAGVHQQRAPRCWTRAPTSANLPAEFREAGTRLAGASPAGWARWPTNCRATMTQTATAVTGLHGELQGMPRTWAQRVAAAGTWKAV